MAWVRRALADVHLNLIDGWLEGGAVEASQAALAEIGHADSADLAAVEERRVSAPLRPCECARERRAAADMPKGLCRPVEHEQIDH